MTTLPIARFDGHRVSSIPKTIDAIEDELARNAVEKISDRPAKESRPIKRVAA